MNVNTVVLLVKFYTEIFNLVTPYTYRSSKAITSFTVA